MNSKNKSLFQETSDLFSSESEKLKTTIDKALAKPVKLSIPEIVDAYYQITNVNSIAEFLKQHLSNLEHSGAFSEEQKTLFEQIKEIEILISERFNTNLHPLILSQLENSIAESMSNLKSAKKGIGSKKTKPVIEQEAKLYEKLRETMSTKEFVDQYDKGLEND